MSVNGDSSGESSGGESPTPTEPPPQPPPTPQTKTPSDRQNRPQTQSVTTVTLTPNTTVTSTPSQPQMVATPLLYQMPPNGVIFSLAQPQGNGDQPQFITIPLSVAMAATNGHQELDLSKRTK